MPIRGPDPFDKRVVVQVFEPSNADTPTRTIELIRAVGPRVVEESVSPSDLNSLILQVSGRVARDEHSRDARERKLRADLNLAEDFANRTKMAMIREGFEP